MTRPPSNRAMLLVALALSFACGCQRTHPDPAPRSGRESGKPVTNRIDIPQTVRDNLGITFARVETRNVARTLRLPGRFEFLPDGRREYRTMVPGRVEVLVSLHQRVAPGTPLYRIDSARWRELQQLLADAEAAVQRSQAGVDTISPLRRAHAVHEQSLREAVNLLETRVRELERVQAATGGKADELSAARIEFSKSTSVLGEITEKDAELDARERLARVELDAARSRLSLLISTATNLTGAASLPAGSTHAEAESRRTSGWKAVDMIEARSVAAGTVESVALASGAWADEAALVLRIVDPERIQFRGRALQSKVARLAGITTGRIVPPAGDAGATQPSLEATVILGTGLDPASRTLDVFARPKQLAPWAQSGSAGLLELVTGGTAPPGPSVPVACVTRDGTISVLFRRDPKDPDKAIRLEADLGGDDGRWIIVKSGVAEGDEIVMNGAWQLMLASSGSAAKGGHFHADGTFHEGDK